MKLLIFEGISGSGKTTLFHPIHALSNYQDLHIHRFTPTNWVYDHLCSRREVDYEWFNQKLQSIIDTYVIWCDCSSSVALERQISKGDSRIEDLEKATELFTEYFSKITSFTNVIHLFTDILTIDQCVDTVKRAIYDAR